jgi:[ribosomal protein S18]-alanine N-acetyltransferase
VKIRAMREGDIAPVMKMAASLKEAPHWTQEAYARSLDLGATPRRIALVAEDLDVVITGVLVAMLIPPHAELESIAVASTVQRQGVGGRLLADLLTSLRRAEITKVMLEVRASNHAARDFYACAGFAETARRPGYYSDPEEDAILLARQVSRPKGTDIE